MICIFCARPERCTSSVVFMQTGDDAAVLAGHTTSREPCICTVTAHVPSDCAVSQGPRGGPLAQPASTPAQRRTIDAAEPGNADFIARTHVSEELLACIVRRVPARDQCTIHTSCVSSRHPAEIR